jgi:membrane-bound lytic murein transglycosylase D
MIWIFLTQAVFALNLNFAIDSNTYSPQSLVLERKDKNFHFSANKAIPDTLKERILKDEDNRIGSDFKIPNYFKSNVFFWFSIYTQYSYSQIVIHDKLKLDLIYESVDFDYLRAIYSNTYLRFQAQNRLIEQRVDNIQRTLMSLAYGKEPESRLEKMVYRKVSSLYSIPQSKVKRFKFFSDLSHNIRTQTGQRNLISDGMKRSLPYLNFLNEQFRSFELPHEMLAISFLESSFNPRARSKANAVGAWQIMPIIAKKIMPYRKRFQDTRYNPAIASIAAFHLLKENFTILNRWDLAVTAYNSGTKHLLKAKRLLGSKFEHSLENIFLHYDNDHHGFASKNFYSEFLALVHVLAYKEIIFDKIDFDTSSFPSLNVYSTLCRISPKFIYGRYTSSSNNLKGLNTHLLKANRSYPKGTLIVSAQELPSNKYYKLSNTMLRRSWPINLKKYSRNKRCK